MKSAANGGLNLSVLDGWWVEGYDGENGWEIDGHAPQGEDEAAQDARHAHALYDLLEQQVIPLFHDRDADGIPRRWLAMVKRSLRTNGPRFSAARMVEEYAARDLPAGADVGRPPPAERGSRSDEHDEQAEAKPAQTQSTASNEPVTSRTAPRTNGRDRGDRVADPSISPTSAPTRSRVCSKSSGRVITSAKAPPCAMPASSAQKYAAPGSATRPTAPTRRTALTPTSHGRLPP